MFGRQVNGSMPIFFCLFQQRDPKVNPFCRWVSRREDTRIYVMPLLAPKMDLLYGYFVRYRYSTIGDPFWVWIPFWASCWRDSPSMHGSNIMWRSITFTIWSVHHVSIYPQPHPLSVMSPSIYHIYDAKLPNSNTIPVRSGSLLISTARFSPSQKGMYKSVFWIVVDYSCIYPGHQNVLLQQCASPLT